MESRSEVFLSVILSPDRSMDESVLTSTCLTDATSNVSGRVSDCASELLARARIPSAWKHWVVSAICRDNTTSEREGT